MVTAIIEIMKKVLPVLLAMAGASASEPQDGSLADLHRMIARFAPTEIRIDTSALSAGDQKALVKLIEASRIVNTIFLTQLWSGNLALMAQLEKDSSPLGKARLHYFWINKGPWSDLDGHAAFLPGVPPKKLPGANFYPPDMTKDEFESWVKRLPEGQRKDAEGFFTGAAVTMPGGCRLYRIARHTRRNSNRRRVCCVKRLVSPGTKHFARFWLCARKRFSPTIIMRAM